MISTLEELADIVEWMDADLDGHVAEAYVGQLLAQDWGRVAKLSEEVGEAIDALIGITGQNPRKGEYGDMDDLLHELSDCALTAIYAMQHFTKCAPATMGMLLGRAEFHKARREDQLKERS